MMYIMKRYQLYLNPQSVRMIDAFQKEVKLSRSQIIRCAIDALAHNLIQVLPEENSSGNSLDALIGVIGSKSQKTTNIAQDIDSIYQAD